MKISAQRLRQIINEELQVMLTDDEAIELFGDQLRQELLGEAPAEDAATKLRGGKGLATADVVAHEKERVRDLAAGSMSDFNRQEKELVVKLEDFMTKVGQQDNLLKYIPILQRTIDTIKQQSAATAKATGGE